MKRAEPGGSTQRSSAAERTTRLWLDGGALKRPLDLVREHVERLRNRIYPGRGGDFRTCCPLCGEGGKRGLSVFEARTDGHVVLICHKGRCHEHRFEELLDRLGLKPEDLYYQSQPRPSRAHT